MKILIVDDELPARKKVIHFLSAHADCTVVGQAGDGLEALHQIAELGPDLVFLDINMPGLDGFQVLGQLPEDRCPQIIFATAYNQHAVQAFEVNAVDYLLKPFDRARFDAALEKARQRCQTGARDAGLTHVLNSLAPAPKYPARLLVHDKNRVRVVPVADIDWIQSAANYAVLFQGSKEHIMRTSLSALEAQLDPTQFARAHRGHLVNLDRIVEIKPHLKGDMVILLRDGRELKLSRRYKELFLRGLEER